MSDQNSDTSRSVSTTNKNPLLSASVTGLTFDDFTNKAIILPAAALPPKLPEPKDPEPTKPVIFGTEPAILDTESFSEISLDQPSDQETYPANPLQDDQYSPDYSRPFNTLTQATHLTASLSQLPSVASSVFSSFSSILRGTSPSPNATSSDQQQQRYQQQQHQPYPQVDAYNPLPVQTLGDVPLDSSLSYQSEESDLPAVVPTFYSTSDPAFPPPAPTLSPPPSNLSSGNAYRLTTKRKIYAPAPGLTHLDNQPVPSVQAVPSQAPPLPHPINEPSFQVNQPALYQDIAANQPALYQDTAVNQPPSQNNKFSFTSFFATPLIEKITGTSASHTQETPTVAAVPDIFTVPSANQPVSISDARPGLFDTNPVPENLPAYPAQQQTFQPQPSLSAPVFFNPTQHTNPTPLSTPYGTSEPISTISSIPPSTIPPATGNLSNYRLRGKPHYKNPLSSTTSTTPFVAPFLQAVPSPAPSVGIFNPVNLNTSSEQPAQSVAPTVSPSPSVVPQQLPPPPNVAFFNQPQSVPEPEATHFTQFTSNNFGNAAPTFDAFGREAQLNTFGKAASNFDSFGQSGQTQEVEAQQSQFKPFQPEPPQLQAGRQPNQFQPFQQQPLQPQSVQQPCLFQPFQLPPDTQKDNSQSLQHQQQQQTILLQPFQLPAEAQEDHSQTVQSQPIQHQQQQQSFSLQPFQLPAEAQEDSESVQQQTFQQQQQQQPSLLQPFQIPAEAQEDHPSSVQQQTFPTQQDPHQLNPADQEQSKSVENQADPQQHSTLTQYPVRPSSPHQAQLPLSYPTSESQSNLFQPIEPVKESGQLQQLFQQQPNQFAPEQSVQHQPPTPFFANPFPVPTQSVEQPNIFGSDVFAPFQPYNQPSSCYPPPQSSSTGSVELNPYTQQEGSTVGQSSVLPQYTEGSLDSAQTKLSELNLNPQETVSEAAFFDQVENTAAANLSQQTDTASVNSETSSNFDNFFNRSTLQQSTNLTFSNPPLPEPVATTNLASSFFASSSSDSSAVDWFNPSKPAAPSSTNQYPGDINRNTQAPTDRETTLDASNFFATNNNQTSSPPNYFQIQNFFNNPPLIADSKEQDDNFNFIENNLINKRLHNLTHKASTETDGGSISSNIVEPPSSAQSEFSEFAEVNPETVQSDEYVGEQQFPVDSPNTATMANATDQSNGGQASASAEITNVVYRPVYKHWFYNKKLSDQKPTWTPFPMNDSLNLEEAYTSNSNQCITTNGGRYDVDIEKRERSPIYWNGTADEVRRCSWFYKGADSRLVPYEESVADLLEEEYRLTSQSGEWNRKIVIPSGEVVMFQAPSIMVHFLAAQTPDLWPNASVPPTANRPRVVKRGVDEFNIEDGEPEQINHLLFMVHGIGAGCDLKFRSVEEVVEDFRAIALQLTQSHYASSCDRGEVGRIEVLPVSWHTELHSEESGIDEKLKAITLESIPKLRTFTNETLLDILFYSSPVFCQKIMDTVAGTINKMYLKYCERNPNFKGNVSLAGHSLGSLILFDLLQNQKGPQCFDSQMDVDRPAASETNEEAAAGGGIRSHKPLSRTRSKKINYTIGPAGTGQPYINYPQLVFHPKKFFALGSPIGMFVTVRGIDNLGLNYKLPTTDGFYNIFHPYDPVAYRIEALVNNELIPIRPVLIPHHKGRKRMHLELRETMARVGADIKQKIIDTFKSVYNFASLQKNDPKTLQQEVDKVLEQQLSLETSHPQRTRACSTSTTSSDDNGDTEFSLGMLNEGKRIDYVLQEAPLEFFNEYLFALTSHVCYWDSADTILFIVKEIYTSLGMQTDSQIPQTTMTIERPISTPTPTPINDS